MKYNTRILIVDDNESIHEDFRKVLVQERSDDQLALDELESELFGDEEDSKENTVDDFELSYQVESAFQGRDAIQMVNSADKAGHPYALVFMDVRMPPGLDGIETISRIWRNHPYAEMVLCTAYSDYTWDDIVEKLGSTDKLLFLRKPFDAVAVQQMALSLVKKWNLGEQARNYVTNLEQEVQQRTIQLQDLLKELEIKNAELALNNDQLKHAALHDPLTGLPNRILFHDRLDQAMELAKRNKTKFSIALMDLNGFKNINDEQGHLIGDQVLKVVAERSRSVLRASDTAARLGGDEFAFVLHSADGRSPEHVAEKLLDVISAPIPLGGGGKAKIGASIGVSIYPDDGIDNDHLIGKADTAMYDAKRRGDGVCVHGVDTKKVTSNK